MSVQQVARRVEITISEPIYQWLYREAQRRAQDVSSIVQAALEDYVEQFNLTQTRTWELRGTVTVAEPEPEYVIGTDEVGNDMVDYSERVDDVLYRGV